MMFSVATHFGEASLPAGRGFGGITASDVGTFASSCAKGAAAGAAVGTIIPGVGNLIGGGAGCVAVGLFNSLTSSGVDPNQARQMILQQQAMIRAAYEEELKKAKAARQKEALFLIGGAAVGVVLLIALVKR